MRTSWIAWLAAAESASSLMGASCSDFTLEEGLAFRPTPACAQPVSGTPTTALDQVRHFIRGPPYEGGAQVDVSGALTSDRREEHIPNLAGFDDEVSSPRMNASRAL